MKANSVLMKELNKDMVRKHLKLAKSATKPELAAKTGLSVVTVNSLITEMVESGEVLQGECIPSNGGRPSTQYFYNKDYSYAAIIYGHQDNNRNLIQLTLVNLSGETVTKKGEYFADIKVESFDEWLDEMFIQYPAIGLVAFGLPGEEENQVITINDYPDIIGDEFMKHYKERYKVPVIFENDVNASVSGYYYSHQEPSQQNVVGIYFPRIYLPGAGVLIGGEIYHGAQNFAGEFTFIPTPYAWRELEYNNPMQVSEVLGQLLAMYSCILAPDHFVLYGDFWTEEIKVRTKEYADHLLKGKFKLKITFSESLDQDFEKGMIHLALDYLENQHRIERSYL